MNEDKLKILNLITNMWHNDIELKNGIGEFEIWCKDNLDNANQMDLMNKVKVHVDAISGFLDIMQED